MQQAVFMGKPLSHMVTSFWRMEIKAAAKTFQEVQFVHERRESNFEAHSVATSALFNSVGQHVWFFGLADGICNFVLTDQ
jgi:hypothetical protein